MTYDCRGSERNQNIHQTQSGRNLVWSPLFSVSLWLNDSLAGHPLVFARLAACHIFQILFLGYQRWWLSRAVAGLVPRAHAACEELSAAEGRVK